MTVLARCHATPQSKKNFNLGEPTIHIYKGAPHLFSTRRLCTPFDTADFRIHRCADKRTGRAKGDCTISYEDTDTAQAAIKWFDGSTYMNRPGSKLSVSIAQRPAWSDDKGKGKGKGKGGGKGGGKGY